MAPPPLTAESLLRHAAFVRSVARATLRGDDLVDDAVQDTYVAALEHGATRKGALRPWLGGVARRKAALLVRGRAAARRREAKAARPDHVDDVAKTAARAETGRRLIDAVLDLDEPYRTVILLRFYEGLPPREVARRLDIPVETVRTRVKRGLKRLRAVLEERQGHDWRKGLLLLAAPPLTSSATSGLTVGGIVVSKKLLMVAACLLVLVGAAVWALRSDATTDAPQETETTTAATLSGEAETTDAPELVGGTPAKIVAKYPNADREIDIHGIVVDTNGDPIAGAALGTFTLPWLRANLMPDMARWTDEHGGKSTTSAADGSFVIRVPRNSRWNLRVSAKGYLTRVRSLLRSGERVRVVMDAGVSVKALVLDAEGNPLPEARVGVFRDPDEGDLYVFASVKTGADGIADLGKLPGGFGLRAFATHPAHGAMLSKPQIASGGATTIRLEMRPGRVVSGVVTDHQTGDPIANARVGLMWNFFVETRTDDQGRYELGGWFKKLGSIHVQASGYTREMTPVSETGTVDFALVPGGRVKGRVLSAKGVPLSGVPIAALSSQRQAGDELISNGFTRTDSDGTFELGGLRHHWQHTLHVLAPHAARLRRGFVVSDDRVLDLQDLTLQEGGHIIGTLRRADGTPIARQEVLMEGPKESVGANYGIREEAFTDDLGRFGFADLTEGTYQLTVKDTQFRRSVQLPASGQVTVDFQESAPQGHRVVVVDEQDRPVAGVEVRVHGPNGMLGKGATNATGTFTVESGTEPVHVSVWLTEAQKQSYLRTGMKWPEGEDEARVVLKKARSIAGTLIGEDGKPYGYAVVAARLDGKYLASGWSNEQGRFVIALPPGDPVDVHVTGQVETKHAIKDGYMKSEQMPIEGGFDGVERGTTDLTIRLRALPTDKTLTLIVTNKDGEPLAGTPVYLGTNQDDIRATDQAGRVTFEELIAREVVAWVGGPHIGGRTYDGTQVKVTPGGPEVTVQLEEALFFQGLVQLPDGTPAHRALVTPEIPGVISTNRTNDKGEFWMSFALDKLPVFLLATYKDKAGKHFEGRLEIVDAKSLPVIIRLAAKDG